MKVCSVPNCNNNSNDHPDYSFFCLPKTTNIRSEWLEAVGGKKGLSPHLIKVCQVHFKPKDFVNGKKQLKFHAVPILRLGPNKTDLANSDDEFMQYGSADSDLEVIELPSKTAAKKNEIVEKPVENKEKHKKDQADFEVEEENKRRPTRRAARVAAKKILHTARNINVSSDDTVYIPPSPRPVQRTRARLSAKVEHESVDLDLHMECEEEILSEVQAESMLKSQIEYNQVMKKLRTLRSENCKIIEVDTYDMTTLKSSPVPVLLSSSVVS